MHEKFREAIVSQNLIEAFANKSSGQMAKSHSVVFRDLSTTKSLAHGPSMNTPLCLIVGTASLQPLVAHMNTAQPFLIATRPDMPSGRPAKKSALNTDMTDSAIHPRPKRRPTPSIPREIVQLTIAARRYGEALHQMLGNTGKGAHKDQNVGRTSRT